MHTSEKYYDVVANIFSSRKCDFVYSATCDDKYSLQQSKDACLAFCVPHGFAGYHHPGAPNSSSCSHLSKRTRSNGLSTLMPCTVCAAQMPMPPISTLSGGTIQIGSPPGAVAALRRRALLQGGGAPAPAPPAPAPLPLQPVQIKARPRSGVMLSSPDAFSGSQEFPYWLTLQSSSAACADTCSAHNMDI